MLRDFYIHKDFVWKLLDWVIYKTLYGNPLDFSKIYDIVMNDEIKIDNLENYPSEMSYSSERGIKHR